MKESGHPARMSMIDPSETPAPPEPDEPTPLPIIVTLAMEPSARTRFQSLRDAHFPPALNRVPAHLTLFHHLPGERANEVDATVAKLCAARTPFDVEVTEVRSIGRGVAYRCASEPLIELRAAIAAAFEADLTRQDRQGWRPHVTVQNKVTGDVAKRTLATLSEGFEPWSFRADGLALWDYMGGPWRERLLAPFAA